MPKKRRRAAATLDQLEHASERVPFLRTDAREASVVAPVSRTRAKEALACDLDPEWSAASPATTTAVLRQLGADCAANSAPGVRLGRSAVTRALRRGELAALIVSREGGPPLSYAHLAAHAQQHGTAVSLLACSSAQLGQPFGLLRASCIGLLAHHFPASHPLVQLVQRTASSSNGSAGLLPWLKGALTRIAPQAVEPTAPSASAEALAPVPVATPILAPGPAPAASS